MHVTRLMRRPLVICLLLVGSSIVSAEPNRTPVRDAVLTSGESSRDDLVKDGAARNVHAGADAATESVMPDGSFAYTIPIAIPKGTGGLAPNLSFVYDSNVRNGLLGIGWNLTGLPSMTREKSRGVSGKPGQFEGQDDYVYNESGWGNSPGPGSRLIPTGASLSAYHSVTLAPSTLWEPGGTCGDGPCWWRMRDGKGDTFYFGGDADVNAGNSTLNSVFWERQPVPDNGWPRRGIVAWLLFRVVDVNGNEYRVDYDTDSTGDAPLPKRIRYSMPMEES